MGIDITLSDLKEIYMIIPEKYRLYIGLFVILCILIVIFYKYKDFISIRLKTISSIINPIFNFRKLWIISVENSRDYEKMIDFDPCRKCDCPIIKASDLSPHIDFSFYITNRTIIDFKIKKISMNILDQDGSYIDKFEAKEIDLPHQQIIPSNFKHKLNQKFIDKLKSLKEKCESQWIILNDVKIYLKDKKSPISWTRFNLKIHPRDIHL